MKPKIIFILFIFICFGLSAQNNLNLQQLYIEARQNNPLQKQSDLLLKKKDINNQITKNVFYPKLDFNAQGTYQSDVTEISIPIPGVNMPNMSKDQYRMNINANQLIYDGGMTKALQDVEDIKMHTFISEVEVELYNLYNEVSNTFFGILFIDENQKALDDNIEEIDSRIKTAKSAVENGMLLQNNLDKLFAAKLRLNEKQIELKYDRIALLNILSQFTGIKYENDVEIDMPTGNITNVFEFKRPENLLFEKQKQLIAEQKVILKKSRQPKVFAFGEIGYGKPGYDMFADSFNDYYMLGIKLNWNIYDWSKTKRQNNALSIDQEIINNKEDALNLNLNIAAEKHLVEINKIDKLIQNEEKIVSLQKKILSRTSSQLDYGTITTSEYLSDLNEHSQAVIRLNNLKIRKLRTQIELQIVTGQIRN